MPAFPSGAAGLYEQSLTANTVSTVTFADLEGTAQGVTVWNLGSATIYAKAGATTTVGDTGAVAILAGSAGDVFVGAGAVLALISTGTPTYSVVRSSRKPSPLYPGAGGGGGSTDVSALSKETTQASVLAKLSADLGVVQKVGGAAVSTANPVPVLSPLPGDVVANGTLGALNATVAATIGARDTIVVQLTGTWVGTITLQGSLDNGVTWTSINGPATWLNVATGANATALTANGLWQATVSAVPQVRVIMSAYTSGTATVYLDVTDGNAMIALDAPLPAGSNEVGYARLRGADGGNTVVKGSGTAAATTDNSLVVAISPNSIGKVGLTDGTNPAVIKASGAAPATTDAALVASVSPNSFAAATGAQTNLAATTNAVQAKAAAGTLFQLDISNYTGTAFYLKIYNASTITVGTTVPVQTILVPTATSQVIEFGQYGKRFANGIAFSTTANVGDADATAIVLTNGPAKLGVTYL